MNWHPLLERDWAELIHRLSDDVHHASQSAATYRGRNWSTLTDGLHAANHAVGCRHRDATHAALAEVLLHFENDVDGRRHREAVAASAKSFRDSRHRTVDKPP